MNRKIMKMASVAVVLLLALCLAGGAVAASLVNFTVQGSNKVFVFTPGSKDLFQNFKNVLPGDSLEQKITVQNTYKGPVRLYVRAEPVSKADKDFLSQLGLTVKANSNYIFSATADKQSNMAATADKPYGVLLGTFAKNGTIDLNVTLNVPKDMGNTYMGQDGVIKWTFTAEEIVMPDTPETGDAFTLWVWVAAGGALVICLLWLIFGRKKQKEA